MEVVRTRQESYFNEALVARSFNHVQHLEADGEIINLDYDPIKLYTILKRANDDQLDEKFHTEIIDVLKAWIAFGTRIFKIVRTPNTYSNNHFLRMGQIFHKYHITDHIQSERHMAKAITMPRIMRLFPHLLAKIVSIDMNIESNISDESLEENGLINISPACFWKSTFCLLPKYDEDVEDEGTRLNIIKTMLLAQHEQMEVIHEENTFRAKSSSLERMRAVFMNCKVIYDSNHILGGVRWTSYEAFLLTDPLNGVKYDYKKAGEMFDTRFSEVLPLFQHAFKLRSGTGIERGTNVKGILKTIKNVNSNRRSRRRSH